jgi:hypothetical protein
MTRLDDAEGTITTHEHTTRQQGTKKLAMTALCVVTLLSCPTHYVKTFTTEADQGIPPNPDPDCASTTVSPTGHNAMHWTPCRQDTIDQMEADYLAVCRAGLSAAVCAATPKTWGGRLFKRNKQLADSTSYGDIGAYRALIVQAKGCGVMMPTGGITYEAGALSILNTYMAAAYTSRPFNAAPYDYVRKTDNNGKRIVPLKALYVLDTIRPCISSRDFDAMNLIIAGFIQSALLDGYSHYPSFSDSDNTVGICFGVWAHYLMTPTVQLVQDNYSKVNAVNPAIGNKIGGFTPNVAAASFDPGASTATCRDTIQWLAAYLAPNAPSESAEYDIHTLTFWANGYDAVKTLAGEDRFPEVRTFLENYATQLRFLITPNLSQPMKWADTEAPEKWAGRPASYVPIMELAGVLSGTTIGRKLHDLVTEIAEVNGCCSAVATAMDISVTGTQPLKFYNPYDARVSWRGELGYTDTSLRLAVRRSHATSTSASQLFVYSGGPQIFNTTLNKPVSIQHQSFVFGDWTLWRNGNWAFQHPFDYGGPSVLGGDGGNVPIIQGFALSSDGYNALSTTHATDYSYILMQQGGSKTHSGYCGTNTHPAPFLNEWTRSVVYAPGTTDLVIVYDRGDVLTTVPLYSTCYSAADRARMEIFTQFHQKLIINHTYTQPTQVGNVFTWMTVGGEAAKMTFLFPASPTHTIINETTDTGYWSMWATKYAQNPQYKRFHVRTQPNNVAQFHTFLSVHEVGTASTVVAVEDSGKVQGVHVDRASGIDIVALFNSQQGSNITATYRAAAHQTKVPAQHFRETGFTFTWTPRTSTTLLLLNDLNPANTWTYTIDGGGSQAISEDAKGHWSATISASSGNAHTIVVTGSQ